VASKTYKSAAQFASQFKRDLSRMAESLVANYHAENHIEARRKMKSFPVRRLRDEYVDLVEGKPSTAQGIRRRRVKPDGVVSTIGNRHGAFHAIDFGHKRITYKRHKPTFTRMGGSSKVARGMTKPTAEHLLSSSLQTRLRVRAIRKAERTLR
jgi:hypothetical protein